MRPIAVLTVAFVFAAASLFVATTSAQSPSLQGQVCAVSPYSYDDGASDPASPCAYGAGLPDATVTLTKAGPLPVGPAGVGPTTATASTDANGFYAVSNLASGSYTYKIARAGFQDATGTVEVGQAKSLDARLQGNAVEARGKVMDASGDAIPKASISMCCGEGDSPSASTGSDGRFSASVVAGYWSISVSAPGFQAQHVSRLVDGSDLSFTLQPVPPQDSRITGTVLDQDGNPVPEARVTVSNYGYSCCPYTMDQPQSTSASKPASEPASSDRAAYYGGENYTLTGADGRFSIGAYPGYNSIFFSKDGHASQSRGIEVTAGQPATVDVELVKFPEKTARLVGKLVDGDGKAVRHAYLSVQSPAFGIHECSDSSGSGSGSSGSAGAAEPAIMPVPDHEGCAIALRDDGTFEGMVTPGFAIVHVFIDHYLSCSETSSSSGSFSRSCGPEYYSWSRSLELAPDATTTLDVRLRERPAPDAEVSGYIVDAETGAAIPGASISFSNQDTYGWGHAVTDADGSYRLALRSGYHVVNVWAEGHLRWEGILDVAKGDTPYDVQVVPGQESYGGYYGYGPERGYAVSEDSGGKSAGAPNQSGGLGQSGLSDESEAGMQYEDLGGGLGPYDAAARRAELESGSQGSPGLGLLAMLGAVGAIAMLRRRVA